MHSHLNLNTADTHAENPERNRFFFDSQMMQSVKYTPQMGPLGKCKYTEMRQKTYLK